MVGLLEAREGEGARCKFAGGGFGGPGRLVWVERATVVAW